MFLMMTHLLEDLESDKSLVIPEFFYAFLQLTHCLVASSMTDDMGGLLAITLSLLIVQFLPSNNLVVANLLTYFQKAKPTGP